MEETKIKLIDKDSIEVTNTREFKRTMYKEDLLKEKEEIETLLRAFDVDK